jgi:hypothetical protein
MEDLSMLWTKYWGSRKKLQDISFPENEIVSPPYLRKVSRISQATFVNLHPTHFAVAIAPDGRIINLKGGYNMLPSGYYNIHYVDKRNRVNHIPRTEETTSDGFQVAMELVISYRVIDPIRALEIQNPVDTLLRLIQANLKEFIRSHKYDEIMGDLDGKKIDNDQVVVYIKEQQISRSPLARLFYILDVVVKERIGDPRVIELREKYQITQKQLDYRSALQAMNRELERKTADQEALIKRIKAESEVIQWNILYKTKLQERELSNKWGVSPQANTEITSPNDLLRLKISLPPLLSSTDLFASLPQQLNAIEYIYSIFAILGLGDIDTVNDLVESLRFGKELTKASLYQLLANANIEPLRIASFHYGSPATINAIGRASIMTPLQAIIKRLTWRWINEEKMAEYDLRLKELEVQKAISENEDIITAQKLANEKSALENQKSALDLERYSIELKKQKTELIAEQIELLLKMSKLDLEPEKKRMIIAEVEALIPLLSSNPITPLLGSEIDEINTPQLEQKPDDSMA